MQISKRVLRGLAQSLTPRQLSRIGEKIEKDYGKLLGNDFDILFNLEHIQKGADLVHIYDLRNSRPNERNTYGVVLPITEKQISNIKSRGSAVKFHNMESFKIEGIYEL